MGADAYLAEIAAETSVPVLRKDFVVCERMIYQAKVLGASAVLLICAILNDEQLIAYREPKAWAFRFWLRLMTKRKLSARLNRVQRSLA